jgi:hypothetical protein
MNTPKLSWCDLILTAGTPKAAVKSPLLEATFENALAREQQKSTPATAAPPVAKTTDATDRTRKRARNAASPLTCPVPAAAPLPTPTDPPILHALIDDLTLPARPNRDAPSPAASSDPIHPRVARSERSERSERSPEVRPPVRAEREEDLPEIEPIPEDVESPPAPASPPPSRSPSSSERTPAEATTKTDPGAATVQLTHLLEDLAAIDPGGEAPEPTVARIETKDVPKVDTDPAWLQHVHDPLAPIFTNAPAEPHRVAHTDSAQDRLTVAHIDLDALEAHSLHVGQKHAELVLDDGDHRIAFAITANQQRVHVVAKTDAPEAAAHMLAHKHDLEIGLERRGLELGGFALGDGDPRSQKDPEPPKNQASGAAEAPEEEEETAPSNVRTIA